MTEYVFSFLLKICSLGHKTIKLTNLEVKVNLEICTDCRYDHVIAKKKKKKNHQLHP